MKALGGGAETAGKLLRTSPSPYTRKTFNNANDALDQLESIEKHQDVLKGANKLTDEGTDKIKKIIDSKQKSKSRWKNATKGIKNLKDALDEGLGE